MGRALSLDREPSPIPPTHQEDQVPPPSDQPDTPRLLASLKSHTSWPPLSLSIRTTPTTLIASIAYTLRTYTSGYTVGLQELHLSLTTGSVKFSRLTSALPQGFTSILAPSSSPSSASNSENSTSPAGTSRSETSCPTSLSYSHPYILATHPDNALTLYLCTSTASTLSITSGTKLWGHTSSVSSAEITPRGKAVSVSTRGNELRGWELEGGLGGSSTSSSGLSSSLRKRGRAGVEKSVVVRPAANRDEKYFSDFKKGYMATVYTEDLRQLIHQLLGMCGFDTSLGSKNDLPIKASWDALQDLLYYMHLESISEAIGRCADLTASLSKSLGLTGPVEAVRPELQGTPKAQQTRDIDVALQMVVNYAAERQLRADHQRNLEIASRWLRLDALDFVMRTRQKRIQHVESELTAMLYCRLSDEKKARYDAAVSLLNSRPPSLAFVEKRHLLLRLRKPEQHLSKEVATAMEQSNLPTEMEPVQMKEVALRPYDAASSRPAIRLSARPHRSSFPMPMPLEAMRTKAELDVAAAS